MPTEILMPQLGMGMTEGVVAHWLVQDAAAVKRGDALLEIETDKVTHTIEAPTDGIVQQVAAERKTVPVAAVVAYLLSEGEAPVAGAGGSPRPAAVATAGLAVAAPAAPAVAAAPAGEVRASPIARRLATQHGIDLATIVGTGPGGRIVEADVQAAMQRAAAAPSAPAAPRSAERKVLQRIPLTGRRKVIAERMMASLATTAQLTISREVDVQELVQARQALVARADALGVRVAYDAIIAKALATALAEQPALNATVEEDAIVLLGEVHVAIAIAAEAGLIVPVVRNAQSRSLLDIARAVDDFANRARQGGLLPDELSGGTVTITNIGGFGVDVFTPILNPPQSAILGIGRIQPRVVVVEGMLAIRPVLTLSLTWDHRVADGAPAAQLLGRVVDLLGDRNYLASLA